MSVTAAPAVPASTSFEARAERAPALPTRRAARPLRLALAGCGTVGGALARLVAEQRAALRAHGDVDVEVVRVLVRDPARPRDVPLAADLFTRDVDAFLDTDADVVVEALGGLEPSRRVAEGALARGRRLVTANKTLVAAHGPRLATLAAERGGALDFEAAVGGAVPVVRALRDGVAGVGVRAVRGVVNGTCNYLLGRLADGATWDDALVEAQRLGFAEPDPTLDVTGADAAAKLRVLAWLAFGLPPAALDVPTRGIAPDAARLVALAASTGRVCRLVAECVRTPEGIVAAVEPIAVAADSELGRVTGERNVVLVESASAGTVTLGGAGAGGTPTAGALLADVLRGAAGPVHQRAVRDAADRDGADEDDARAAHARAADADPRVLRWLVAPARPAAGDDGWALPALRAAAREVGATELPGPRVARWRAGAGPTLAVHTTRARLDALVERAQAAGLAVTVLRYDA